MNNGISLSIIRDNILKLEQFIANEEQHQNTENHIIDEWNKRLYCYKNLQKELEKQS